ncbi:MAG: diacylglycerol/lipid kinase family protein [Candidatus Eiseniibacteriota bacterium]
MDSLFLVNPRAGRGRGERIARELPALLAARGARADVRITEAPRDAVRLAREAAAAGASLVVAVGGDGTAHEVVNGIAGSRATFALIPVGSGNDLALALGIPSELDAALDVALSGAEKAIDLARFDDAWFANSLGLGFEAQVTIESRSITWLRGFAIYLAAVLRALARLRCPQLVIRADDRVLEGRRLLVCVGNGPRVGGGFYLTPDAVNDDGLLDLCIVEGMGRWRVLRTLPKAIRGAHVGDPRITMLRARSIEIESDEGFPFHADGEVIDAACRRLSVRVVPRALTVRVPRA